MSGPVLCGLVAGLLFGLANLWASQAVARRALRLRPVAAVEVMVLGFLVRLGVLALVVFAVPARWLDPAVFVLTFVAAFFVGLCVEGRLLLRAAGTGMKREG